MDAVVSEVKSFSKHSSLKPTPVRHAEIHASATSVLNHPLSRSRHSSRSSLHHLADHSSSGSGSDSPMAADAHPFHPPGGAFRSSPARSSHR